jgi:hypothetical protein
MVLPQRYIDIKAYFDGLQVAGEMLGENQVGIDIKKYRNYMSITTKTSMAKHNDVSNWQMEHYFKYGPLVGKDPNSKELDEDGDVMWNKSSSKDEEHHFYIPFSIGMSRTEDNIWIEGSLPLVNFTNEGVRTFVSERQIIKMYNNSIGYDLSKHGVENVSLTKEIGKSYLKLSGKLNINHSVEAVAQIYNILKKETEFNFKNLLKQKW